MADNHTIESTPCTYRLVWLLCRVGLMGGPFCKGSTDDESLGAAYDGGCGGAAYGGGLLPPLLRVDGRFVVDMVCLLERLG
jgi:hypothetical protein